MSTVAEVTASLAVVELRHGVDATARVDGDPGQVPILVIATAGVEWLITPGDHVGPAAREFADVLSAAVAEYCERVRRHGQ